MNLRTPALLTALLTLLSAPAFAALKTIEAENLYHMGDNDSRLDARRISTQEAKRKALELAGTYVASLTEVKDYRLTKDEVTAYTAGIIETEVIAEELRGPVQRPEMFIKVRCRIDTGTLRRQIENYRENDDLKAQLSATARENDSLRKERDQLIARLQTEKDAARAEDTKKQLGAVLSREESNDEVAKLWNQLAYRVTNIDSEMSKRELTDAAAAVQARIKADPQNTRARFLLAMIYHRQEDLPAAEQAAREGLSLAPYSPQLRLKLAAVLKDRRRFDEALKELQIVEKARPDDPNMLFHIGMIHAFNDNCGKATSYLQRFLVEAKKTDQPVGERKKRRAARAIKECDRGELEPRRRR